MNQDLLATALTNIDEEWIAEAREEIKPVRRYGRYIIPTVACACTVLLCATIPFAFPENKPNKPILSDPDNKPTTPVLSDTLTEGYEVGDSCAISPYMLAYEMDRKFNEAIESIPVQLSFGLWGLRFDEDRGTETFTKVAVSVENCDLGESYLFKEVPASEFTVELYDVEIEFTYGDLGDEHEVVVSEKRIFHNKETFTFPSRFCNQQNGWLMFHITVYRDDQIIDGSAETVYYFKNNGTIVFQTSREYWEQYYEPNREDWYQSVE